MAAGVAIDQGLTSTNQLLSVPKGQVFLVTNIVIQGDPSNAGITGAFNPSPSGLIASGFTIENAAGTVETEVSFWSFRRAQGVFDSSPVTNWRNAPPANILNWRPRYPLVIPSGWSLNTGATVGQFGNGWAAYGILVDENSARTLGYDVNNSTTDSNRRYGITSQSATTSGFIPARTGKHIRIMDVVIRLQPQVAGSTVKLTLAEGTGRVLYEVTNNNPSELLDLRFTPEWILGQSEELDLTFSVANSGSITVTYEYLDNDDVPGDYFWSRVYPTYPSPGVAGGAQKRISTAFTLFYPKNGSTRTAAKKGDQHWINGYAVSIQKDTTAVPEQAALAISSGTSSGGIAFGALGLTQSAYQISPTITASGHDQTVAVVVDEIDIPCPEQAAIYVDTVGLDDGSGAASALSTPDTADLDVDEWSVTVWGRTTSKRYLNPTNRGV